MCMFMKNTMDLDEKKMKFLLAIVVYNPYDEIINKINGYVDYGLFNRVYVYDNSSISYNEKFVQEIIYDSNGSNDGLAVAYNKCIRYGLDNDYDYVCFLDQDSFFEKSQVQKMQSYIEKNVLLLHDVALIGPWWDKNNPEDNREELVDQKYMINSGTFLNLKIVQEQNVFYDENIFIDGLDYDYCWTMHDIGKRVCMLPCVKMQHQVGEGDSGQSFLHHSADRYYYIAYGKRYIWNKHKGIAGRVLAQISNIRLIFIILMNEDEIKSKALGCIKGMCARLRE